MRHHRPRIVTGTENRANPRKGRVDLCWYPPGTFIRPLRSYAQVRQYLVSVWNGGGAARFSSGSAVQDLRDVMDEESRLDAPRTPVAWHKYRELQKRRSVREAQNDRLLENRKHEAVAATESAVKAAAALANGSSDAPMGVAEAAEAAVAAAEVAAQVAMQDLGIYQGAVDGLVNAGAGPLRAMGCGPQLRGTRAIATPSTCPSADNGHKDADIAHGHKDTHPNSTVFDGNIIYESTVPILAAVAPQQAQSRSLLLSDPAHSASCTSRYRGVSMTESGRWQCQIWVDGQSRDLGVYNDELVAARVYDDACRKHKANWHLFCNFPVNDARLGRTGQARIAKQRHKTLAPPLVAVVPGWGTRRLRFHASGCRFNWARGRFAATITKAHRGTLRKSQHANPSGRDDRSRQRLNPAASKRKSGSTVARHKKAGRGRKKGTGLRHRRPPPAPQPRHDIRPQQPRRKLGYDTDSLTWLDATHRSNKEGVYCYCGGPWDDIRQPAVQCHDCRQIFHVACVDTVKALDRGSLNDTGSEAASSSSPAVFLCGDGAYTFRCAVCSDNGHEILERHISSWFDIVRIAFYNLTLIHQVRRSGHSAETAARSVTCFRGRELCAFINANWRQLCYGKRRWNLNRGETQTQARVSEANAGESSLSATGWRSHVLAALRSNPRCFNKVAEGGIDEGGVWKLLAGGLPHDAAPAVRSLLIASEQLPRVTLKLNSHNLLPANAPLAVIAPPTDGGRSSRYLPSEQLWGTVERGAVPPERIQDVATADDMDAVAETLRERQRCNTARGLCRGAVVWAKLPSDLIKDQLQDREQAHCQGDVWWPAQIIAVNTAKKLVSVLFFGRQPSRSDARRRENAAHRAASANASNNVTRETRPGHVAEERMQPSNACARHREGPALRAQVNSATPMLEQKAESKGLTSKFAGVSWHKGCRKWQTKYGEQYRPMRTCVRRSCVRALTLMFLVSTQDSV